MASDYLKSQEFINDIHLGNNKAIGLALDHAGALFRINGIIGVVTHHINSKIIIEKLKTLEADTNEVSGYLVSEFATAALDVLGAKKYNGDNEKISRLIASKFNF